MTYLDLYDYRRRVFRHYTERNAALLAGEHPGLVLKRFREQRDALFAGHVESAYDEEQRATFRPLPYFTHDPAACVEATLDTQVPGGSLSIGTSGEDSMSMIRAAIARFTMAGRDLSLTMYWIDVYGGGLFLPFKDLTAPEETYGGGRYLFDTVKGSDFIQLPDDGGPIRILLDFNYAYNPSCSYNYRWSCPLAPPENHLPIAVRAGEKKPQ